MTTFKELSIIDLHDIVDHIDMIFDCYNIDKESIKAFWECVEIGNEKQEVA
jgi:hypothetical protein